MLISKGAENKTISSMTHLRQSILRETQVWLTHYFDSRRYAHFVLEVMWYVYGDDLVLGYIRVSQPNQLSYNIILRLPQSFFELTKPFFSASALIAEH